MGMAPPPPMYPGMVPGYPQVPPHMGGQPIPPPHQGYYSRPPPQHQRPPPAPPAPHMALQTSTGGGGVPPQYPPPLQTHPGAHHHRGRQPPQPFPFTNGAGVPVPGLPGVLPPARPPTVVATLPSGPPTAPPSVTPTVPTPTKSAAGGVLPDKLNTVFIGSIAPGINNVIMEKLLKTTGNLTKWKRVQDPTTGNWKAFGFAEYSDADSLLRTLRVIGREGHADKPGPLELKAMDGSDVTKKLLIKVDEKTRQFLDQYEASRTWTVHDSQKDKQAEKSVAKIIQQMNDGTLDMTEPEPESSNAVAEETADTNKTDSKVDAKEATTAEKPSVKTGEERSASDEAIERELNFFRERAAIKEKERREEEERQERLRLRQQRHGGGDRDRRDHRASLDEGSGGKRGSMSFVPASGSNHVELGSSKHDSHHQNQNPAGDVDSEEEAERQRRERERELEEDYKERLRRWEQREQDRAR
ncbi:hypothetical protein DFQ26_008341, partial [Actinomortierella ambigua]